MKRFIVAALASVFASQVQADLDRVSILLGSAHVGSSYDFNERNPGVFLTFDRISVGLYKNSYSRISTAVTYEIPLHESGEFEFSVFGGFAHYPKNGRTFRIHLGDVVPIGGLQARYKNAFLQVMPSDGIFADAVFAAGLTFPFD